MRIYIVLIVAFTLFSFQAEAQKKKKSEPTPVNTTANTTKKSDIELHKMIYSQAMQYGDLGVAINTVYTILALGGEASYKDTLAYLYFNAGNNVQAILVADDILTAQPNNATMLEITAISQQNLGLAKEALANYEKLYALSPDIYHMYSIATLQYSLKRFGECGNTIDQILKADENVKPIKITNNNGQSQEVPIKAACLNMLGVMALELKQTDVALKSFQEALKVAPEFALANGNLAKVTEMLKTEAPKK